jgi:hypothetical protein
MLDLLRHADEPTRRQFVARIAQSALGVSVLPFIGAGANAAQTGGRATRCIYLYMNGAMSHIDTFDPKPKSENQGETGVVKSKVGGIELGEGLPKLAGMADRLALVRSMNTTTGAHEQGRYLMRTGYKQIATTRHPGLGSWMQKLKGKPHRELPATVQIGGGVGPGYLGAQFAPVPIGDPDKGLENTAGPSYITDQAFARRMELSNAFDQGFRRKANAAPVRAYDELYDDAIRLLKSQDLAAFDLSKEPEAVRLKYGDSKLGRGCLLARRLVEQGVQFVEVGYGSWDHHQDLWERLPDMANTLDHALATLLDDLAQRGLLDTTLVVVASEFGRKPNVNQNSGRDHHPAAYTCVLAGGGIKGGQVHGATDADAFYADTDPCSPQDFNATIASALGLPIDEEVYSPTGRPFTIANGGAPIKAFL